MNVPAGSAAYSDPCLRASCRYVLPFWLALLLVTGCSSTPKVDWDSRVGVFTQDEAVLELGPPDRSAELSDGSKVSEWFVKENPSMAVGFGVGSYGSHGGVGVGQTVAGGRSGQYLQLTFGADGRLQRWARVKR